MMGLYSRPYIFSLALVVLALVPASAVGQTQDRPVPTTMPDASPTGAAATYRVGPSDQLAISVYRLPELTSNVTVSADGTITLPSVGMLDVDGKTASEISEAIARVLQEKQIVISPTVNTVVLQVRANAVMVMGMVSRPGNIAIDRPGMTLITVLARAGANLGTGNGIVTIAADHDPGSARQQLSIADIISGEADREVRANEVIVVQPAPMVYVSGEVGRPGAYPIEPGMTVGQAIALGGGITPRGSSGRIRLTRKTPDGESRRIKSIDFQTPVKADDLVVVRTRVF